MTVRVELEKLLEVADGFGTVPMLLTVDPDGRPRAAAVSVTWDGDQARVRAGRKSVANAGERPLVSLMWPAPPGERFALLVDGVARSVEPGPGPKDGGHVTLEVLGGLLHVVAEESAREQKRR